MFPDLEMRHAYAVTPSDTTEQVFKRLYIGVTGDVAITTPSGTVVAFGQCPVGMLYVSGSKVMSTGTGASEIVAIQ